MVLFACQEMRLDMRVFAGLYSKLSRSAKGRAAWLLRNHTLAKTEYNGTGHSHLWPDANDERILFHAKSILVFPPGLLPAKGQTLLLWTLT